MSVVAEGVHSVVDDGDIGFADGLDCVGCGVMTMVNMIVRVVFMVFECVLFLFVKYEVCAMVVVLCEYRRQEPLVRSSMDHFVI